MSNLDKLKKLKKANQQKESEITKSFSIGDDSADVPSEESEKVQQMQSINDPAVKNPDKMEFEDETKIQKTMNADVSDNESIESNENKASIPNITNKSNISHSNKIDEEFPEAEKSITFRFASEEDMQYLDLAPVMNETSKKAFFIELMKNAVKSGPVEFTDETYLTFRSTPLVTKTVTISVPVALISEVKKSAAKNLMKFQRYIAYVIHMARVNDENWVL